MPDAYFMGYFVNDTLLGRESGRNVSALCRTNGIAVPSV